MAALAEPRTASQIAYELEGSADTLEAAAYGISLQAQSIFSTTQNREHCHLAIYYERMGEEARRLRTLAHELRNGGGV